MNPLRLFNSTVRAVIRREYLQRVTNKWFLITTFIVPVLGAAVITIPGWLVAQGGGAVEPLRVGVVDRTGSGLAEAVTAELTRSPRPTARVDTVFADSVPADSAAGGGGDAETRSPAGPGPVPAAPGPGSGEPAPLRASAVTGLPDTLGREGLAARLRTSEYDAYLVLGRDVTRGGEAELLSLRSIGLSERSRIRRAVRSAAMSTRLERAGLERAEADSLLLAADVGLSLVRVADEGLQSQALVQGIGFGMGVVLYLMLLIYGQMIVKGVIEEKSSDIVEVLLSSLRPWELMLGKIVGVGAVGLTQVGIWLTVLATVATYGLAAAAPALAEAGVDVGAVFGLPLGEILGAFLVFFVGGYLLYSSLFAAAGAMAGSEQDAQQVNFPITMVIVAAFVFLSPMMESPGATWAVVASQVPLFSPILMPARVAIGAASVWGVLLGATLLFGGVLGAVWLAGRIYRVGILMSGKRPNLPELVRWIRYG